MTNLSTDCQILDLEVEAVVTIGLIAVYCAQKVVMRIKEKS